MRLEDLGQWATQAWWIIGSLGRHERKIEKNKEKYGKKDREGAFKAGV